MTSVFEKLTRRQREPVAPQEPEPIVVPEPKEEPYPDTIIGVLMRLKRVSPSADASELQHEGDLARAKLLEISQDGISNFRKAAEKSGKKWEGTLEFGNPLREQDGDYWSSSEGVEIGKNTLTVFGTSYEMCGSVTEHEADEVKVSPACQTIYSARYIRTKIYGRERIIINSVNVRFSDNRLTEIDTIDNGPEPRGDGSFYKKPEGPVRKVSIRFLQ